MSAAADLPCMRKCAEFTAEIGRRGASMQNALPAFSCADRFAVRVIEYGRRIRAHLPSSRVEKTLFRSLALGLSPSG